MKHSQHKLELIDFKQLTEILLHHYGITSGWYEVVPEIVLGTGSVPLPGESLPGVVAGVKGVRLRESGVDSPTAVKAIPREAKRVERLILTREIADE